MPVYPLTFVNKVTRQRYNMATDNDNPESFEDAMKGVNPLEQPNRVQHGKSKPSTRPKQSMQDDQQVLIDMLSEPDDLTSIQTGDELFFARDGLQHKVIKRLKRGELSIQAELDLHRLTKLEARTEVIAFLSYCAQNNFKQVRIVHGKGLGSKGKIPVLKTLLNHWLQQRDEILAFCSARPCDGGTGAIYVLLKNSNK